MSVWGCVCVHVVPHRDIIGCEIPPGLDLQAVVVSCLTSVLRTKLRFFARAVSPQPLSRLSSLGLTNLKVFLG